jgi:hypothetical protein
MRGDVKADGMPDGDEVGLASLQRGLAGLWDRAASALASGQEQVAGLALRRRQVLLHELDNLSQLIEAGASNARVISRIEAAARLLEASLAEVSRVGQPQPREPVLLDLDPAVQSDMRRLRAQVRNDLHRRPGEQRRKEERDG